MCHPSARRAIDPEIQPAVISTTMVQAVMRTTHFVLHSARASGVLNRCVCVHCCICVECILVGSFLPNVMAEVRRYRLCPFETSMIVAAVITAIIAVVSVRLSRFLWLRLLSFPAASAQPHHHHYHCEHCKHTCYFLHFYPSCCFDLHIGPYTTRNYHGKLVRHYCFILSWPLALTVTTTVSEPLFFQYQPMVPVKGGMIDPSDACVVPFLKLSK